MSNREFRYFGVRLYEYQVRFLKQLPNMSSFVREAVEEKMQRTLHERLFGYRATSQSHAETFPREKERLMTDGASSTLVGPQLADKINKMRGGNSMPTVITTFLRIPISIWDEPTAQGMIEDGGSVEEIEDFLRQNFREWLDAQTAGAS